MNTISKFSIIILVFLSLIHNNIFAQTQKLQYIKLAEGASIKLPSDFVPMSDDDLALKYPSTKKPLAMYTSADRNADFGLNVSKTVWPQNDLKILQKIYKSTIIEMYLKTAFLKEEIATIDGQQFIVFEFTSEVENFKKYTYVLYKIVKNHVYIFNFTCSQKVQGRWQPLLPKMVSTIKFNIAAPADVKVERKEGVKYYQPKRKTAAPTK